LQVKELSGKTKGGEGTSYEINCSTAVGLLEEKGISK